MADGPDPAVRSAGPHAATAPSAAPRNRRVVSGIRVALWRPATGLWATARARRRPSVPSLWDVSTRAVLSGAVRVLRFQYVHRGDLAGRATGRFRRAGDRGDHLRTAGARGIRCARPAHRDGLFWGRHAHSAAGYGSRADACRGACGVWTATRCRGDNRGEPRYGWAARTRYARRGWHYPHLVWYAIGGAAPPPNTSPHTRPEAGSAGCDGGALGGSCRECRSHLWHTGRVTRRLAAQPGRSTSVPARTHHHLLPHPPGGDGACAAHPAR